MPDVTVKVTISIPQERISDLLCNALEGGSNYWYVIKEFVCPKGKTKKDYEFPHLELPFVKDGSGWLLIGDKEGDMPDKQLDFYRIEDGIQTMAEKYPHHFANFMAEEDDADTGDVFLQCCLFGDVIYG